MRQADGLTVVDDVEAETPPDEPRLEEEAEEAQRAAAARAAEREEAAYSALGGKAKATAGRAARKVEAMLDKLSVVEQEAKGLVHTRTHAAESCPDATACRSSNGRARRPRRPRRRHAVPQSHMSLRHASTPSHTSHSIVHGRTLQQLPTASSTVAHTASCSRNRMRRNRISTMSKGCCTSVSRL